MTDAVRSTGRPVPSEALLRGRLEQAGYVDVESFTLSLPFGPWAKDKYETLWTSILHILTAVSKQGSQEVRCHDAVDGRNRLPFIRYVYAGGFQ
jgi:hypothetical protein